MPFLSGANISTTLQLTIGAMLIESYLAATYVTGKDLYMEKKEYSYNDDRRVIIGVLCVLTIVFCMFQYRTFTQGSSIEMLTMIFSVVGSMIIATYFLSPQEADYSTDKRRKFCEFFYYAMIVLSIATLLGFKEGKALFEADAKGINKVFGKVGAITEDVLDGVGKIGSTAVNTVGDVGSSVVGAVGDVGSSVVGAVGDIGSTAVKTVSDVANELTSP